MSVISWQGNVNRNHNEMALLAHLGWLALKRNDKQVLSRTWRNWNARHFWWERKMAQLIWKTVWQFLQRSNVELPWDLATSIPGMYPRKTNTNIHIRTCMSMFTAALFIRADKPTHSSVLGTGGWTDRRALSCTGTSSTAERTGWVGRENITLGEPVTKRPRTGGRAEWGGLVIGVEVFVGWWESSEWKYKWWLNNFVTTNLQWL